MTEPTPRNEADGFSVPTRYEFWSAPHGGPLECQSSGYFFSEAYGGLSLDSETSSGPSKSS